MGALLTSRRYEKGNIDLSLSKLRGGLVCLYVSDLLTGGVVEGHHLHSLKLSVLLLLLLPGLYTELAVLATEWNTRGPILT